MSLAKTAGKATGLLFGFAIAAGLAFRLGGGGLWDGLTPAIAANNAVVSAQAKSQYDLTALRVVNEVLKLVRDRYVDPKRVKPKEMLLSALNYVQRDVAQVIVIHEEGSPTAKIRVDTQEKEFRIDNVQGPWDVSARLRDIFAFLQDGLRGTEVDLREVEYAACNGMLRTLDPHSVLLSPEAYKEMNLSTSGQFGGLGIVISLRDQQLTVINPMPGTPAARAGVKKYDRIVKINTESTLNMGLTEAVAHLRGAPGTKVTVHIHRDGQEGWAGTRPFDLVRETIRVASVEKKMLEGSVGYVRLKQFQQNTASDLETALGELKKQAGGDLRGLVLDLRGNPGGLLDQATKVADKFLVEGPIVATVGNSEGREERKANADGTEPNYPVALLVNGSSASASEIVAGAMKNHDRAVVIGESSFGKGSVQLVFNELPDKAALKLTIAQYLTEPGDVSIQGVGVTPDIELDPMTVDAQEMDLTVDTGSLRERDLSRSLSNARARDGGRPQEVVRYYLAARDRQELRERGGDPDENFALDFPIRFARDFVTKVTAGKRAEQLRSAKNFINDARASEIAKLVAELKPLGVDWSDAPPEAQPSTAPVATDVRVETDRPQNEVLAGDPMQLRVTVTNKGTTPLYRLYAVTKSDNGLFDNKELVFGKIEPGKSRTATAPLGWCEVEGRKVGSTAPLPKDAPRVCRVPRDTLARADGIKIKFEEARSHPPTDAETRVTVKALERPVFAYGYQIADNRKGNGDGRLQKDEGVTMYLTVKNVGKGRSFETQANLRNLSGEGLLLHEGRFDLSNMAPGESRRVAFTFDVQPSLTESEAKVELSVADRDLRENVAEKVRIPITPPAQLTPASGNVKAKAATDLFESPDAAARMVGRLAAGNAVPELARTGEFVKVGLGQQRFAFARARDVESASAAGAPTFEEVMWKSPPHLELAIPTLSTRDTQTSIKGSAADDERLLDTYIFVGSRKVFYRSNRNGSDAKRMQFDAPLPLRPGVNVVTVVARKNPDTVGRKTFFVRRDGPNGELLATPKTDDDTSEAGSATDD